MKQEKYHRLFGCGGARGGYRLTRKWISPEQRIPDFLME
jgi:hypothetical protein